MMAGYGRVWQGFLKSCKKIKFENKKNIFLKNKINQDKPCHPCHTLPYPIRCLMPYVLVWMWLASRCMMFLIVAGFCKCLS